MIAVMKPRVIKHRGLPCFWHSPVFSVTPWPWREQTSMRSPLSSQRHNLS